MDESGNYDHWKYTTQYTERLSHWPYLTNTAVAYFSIGANSAEDTFYIKSVHNTCLFYGYFCCKYVCLKNEETFVRIT